ncbi:HAD family hydrolase [Candidatus Margulisiibacteriota bacterium]
MEENNLVQMLENHSINHFFKYIYGIENIFAHSKKERACELLKKINIPAENICFIGDTTHDIETAEHIGAKIILVSHGHHSLQKLNNSNYPIIHSFNNLQKTLEEI